MSRTSAEYGVVPPGQAFDDVRSGEWPTIVLVPYTANAEGVDKNGKPDGVRLSVYSEMVTVAGIVLAGSARSGGRLSVLPVGEHTFGLDCPSTSKLMVDRMPDTIRDMVPAGDVEQQSALNSTVHQLGWVARWRCKQGHDGGAGRAGDGVLLVAMEQHAPRLQLTAKRVGLKALGIVDALSVLQQYTPAEPGRTSGLVTADTLASYQEAAKLFNEHNARYEQRAHDVSRWIGNMGVRVLSRVMGPNVVDLVDGHFMQMPARQRLQELQRAA